MISSLDELVSECIDEESKSQIVEAIRCYQNGAYRAAIVATYISVCFDFIQKIKVLAAAGDAPAIAALNELKNLQVQQLKNDPVAIKGLLGFERSLLERFKNDFDFFGINEYEELERLREDRNRCAHPTFLKSSDPYRPSAELVRLHIRNALALVLNQHPRQGRAALASLQNVVTSSYFPKKIEDAVERLKGTEIVRGRTPLVNAFVDDLCFGMITKDHPYYASNVALRALIATVEIHRAIVIPRIANNLRKMLSSSDKDPIRIGCTIASRIPEAAESMDDSGRTVMRVWLKNPAPVLLGNALSRALKIGWLNKDAILGINDLTPEEIAKVSDPTPPEIVSRAARIFSEAETWDDARLIAETCIYQLSDRFVESDLRLIVSKASSENRKLSRSLSFKKFVSSISEQGAEKKAVLDVILEEYGLGAYKVSGEDILI